VGGYQFMGKDLKKKVFNVGKIAVPVIAGAAAAYAFGPAVWGMLGPKLTSAANLIGKGITSVGGSLFEKMISLPQSSQSEVAQEVTPQDIAYAETHNGNYPPHIQALIEQKEREAFEYAAAQTQQSMTSPLQPMLPPPQSPYASSSLYPGLEAAYAAQSQPSQQEDSSAIGSTALIAGGVGILAMLLLRK